MAVYRMDRVNSLLQQEISLILSNDIKEEKARLAVVTHVECSKDLKRAKVFYTTYGKKGGMSVAKALERVAGVIRSLLGRRLKLRTVPELHFVLDMHEIAARKMDVLLDKATEGLSCEEPEELVYDDEEDEDFEGEEWEFSEEDFQDDEDEDDDF